MGDFSFSSGRRGSVGWELDWEGDRVLSTLVEASRRGISEVLSRCADDARAEHPFWENDTGQTEAAVFSEPARIETGPHGAPWVRGEWGVRERPRLRADGSEDDVSTKDVALFLEFGTARMSARPWLYPSWDRNKVTIGPTIQKYYLEIVASGAPTVIRTPGGQFQSFASAGLG